MKPYLILAVLLGTGCAAHAASGTSPSPSPAPDTVVARFGRIRPVLRLSGIVAPYQNVQITSSLAEPADEVRVHNGDVVRKGDVLAVLDSADIRANLETAVRNAEAADAKTAQTRYQASLDIAQGRNSVTQQQSALDQALATLRQDEQDLQRDRQLLSQQFIPQQQYDQQRTRVANDQQSERNAEAALASAIANRNANGTMAQGLQAANVSSAASDAAAEHATILQYQAQLEKTVIRASVDGVITQRSLNPGEYPGTRTLFVLQQLDPVYVDLSASTVAALALAPGSSAVIDVAGTRVQMRGVVSAVLGQSQPGATNFTVELRVPNPDLRLKSGMPVSASLSQPEIGGIIVPVSAFTSELHDHVIVFDHAKPRTVAVTTLGVAGGRAVVSGIPSGARVARSAADAAVFLASDQ